eukprot:GHRQ01010375.1.p1 GENE.GHRQ01010375.1~~GHRQ01010375.1.p1  ORF type:complete len:167 (+),score=9.03 GHRQ01010375.1:733-1233(+)
MSCCGDEQQEKQVTAVHLQATAAGDFACNPASVLTTCSPRSKLLWVTAELFSALQSVCMPLNYAEHQHHCIGRLQGMVENRSCRDVLFLLLFIAYWAGMFVVCGIAFQSGEGALHIGALQSIFAVQQLRAVARENNMKAGTALASASSIGRLVSCMCCFCLLCCRR